jgi:hypothetical protein
MGSGTGIGTPIGIGIGMPAYGARIPPAMLGLYG